MFTISSIVATGKPAEYLPANPETFVHDADGNLTQDGKWIYAWDAESRLIAMETLPAAVTAGLEPRKLEFAYDSQSRRFRKTVSTWNDPTGNWETDQNTVFVYDGWNLIATLRSQVSGLSPQQSYVWGLDLSGTMQGAGGVGGLLAVTDKSGSTYYPSFDGNGNVMGYYAADSGARVAEFEYGPFGESIRATGAKKDEFNFRFSTKYEDAETGLLYYGFRYYDPVTGRWPSRDPIGERGGLNLYGMVGNDPVRRFDILGLAPVLAVLAGTLKDCAVDLAAQYLVGAVADGAINNWLPRMCAENSGSPRQSNVTVPNYVFNPNREFANYRSAVLGCARGLVSRGVTNYYINQNIPNFDPDVDRLTQAALDLINNLTNGTIEALENSGNVAFSGSKITTSKNSENCCSMDWEISGIITISAGSVTEEVNVGVIKSGTHTATSGSSRFGAACGLCK